MVREQVPPVPQLLVIRRPNFLHCYKVWMEVCQCQFDLVMEGYSRVRKVSPEGRSAMTMDVFALHDGLNSIHLCRYHTATNESFFSVNDFIRLSS